MAEREGERAAIYRLEMIFGWMNGGFQELTGSKHYEIESDDCCKEQRSEVVY